MIMMEGFVMSHLAGIFYVIDFLRIRVFAEKYKEKGRTFYDQIRKRVKESRLISGFI